MSSDLILRVRGLGEVLQASSRPKADVGANQFYSDRLALTRAVFAGAEQRRELGDAIVSLTQALAEAEAALEPFAKAADDAESQPEIGMGGKVIMIEHSDTEAIEEALSWNQQPTIGHLRAARQALATIRAAGGGK